MMGKRKSILLAGSDGDLSPEKDKKPDSRRKTRASTVAGKLAFLRQETGALGSRYESSSPNKSAKEKTTVTPEQYNKVAAFWLECDYLFGGRENAFSKFDMNGNGDLTCIEFMHSAVQNRVHNADTKELKKIFAILDRNSDGCISLAEFSGENLIKPDESEFKEKGMKERKERAGTPKVVIKPSTEMPFSEEDGDPSEQATMLEFLKKKFPEKTVGLSFKRGFNAIDFNRSQSVSQTEFYSGLERLGYPGTKAEWKKLFFSMDIDGDGILGLGEFSNWQAAGIKIKEVKAINRPLTSSGKSGTSDSSRTTTPEFLKHTRGSRRGSKVARRFSWSRRSTAHTAINTEKYDDRNHLQEAGEAVILQGATSGWERAAGHNALVMLREPYCEKVRAGLTAMANERMKGKGLAMRSQAQHQLQSSLTEPEPLRVLVHVPHEYQKLPVSNSLEQLFTEDKQVFRRTSYD
jgi:Ca2+-binding EF-hand superfamily protein